MRIVLDVTPLSRPRTGIGNYIRGMVTGLAEAADGRHELVAFGPSGPRGRARIRESLAGLPLEQRLPLLPRSQVWRSGWSRLGWPTVESVVGRLDVFHFSDWMYPSQRHGVRATTVHDLVPLRFPEWVEPATLRMHGPKYENAARTCDRVFVNSRFTAGEVRELLGVPDERIVVAYPGIDPRFRAGGEQADLGGPYVLAVSTLEPRKNLPALVAAFERLRKRRPVVEALACGTPAVVSSHPSLDEASGGIALRADPDDPEAFARALEEALDSPRGTGVEHASRFTWRACGEAVLAGYESALTN
jgi:glycosyltransferase involved in cell wall biosynthesis